MKSRNIFFRKKNSNSLVQYTQFYVCSRKKNKQKQREGGKATTKRIIMENNKAQREESERAPDTYTFFFFKRVTLKPARESCATKRSNIYPKYPRESDSQLHRTTNELFNETFKFIPLSHSRVQRGSATRAVCCNRIHDSRWWWWCWAFREELRLHSAKKKKNVWEKFTQSLSERARHNHPQYYTRPRQLWRRAEWQKRRKENHY